MNAVSKQIDEMIVRKGPFIRGSELWVERERARQRLGASCVNPNEIPTGQAHGEHKAHLQQAEIPEFLRDQVREELRARGQLK